MSYRLIMTIMSGVLETYVHALETCIGRSVRFFSILETNDPQGSCRGCGGDVRALPTKR
jgi:hypothetical protein